MAELEKFGWYNKNCGGRSHPVGTKLPNAFGLFDMHGNLYEWCSDFWDAKWYEKSPLNDPNSQSASDQRVIRGGSWFRLAADCRSAFRNLASPSIRDRSSGFRVVRVLDGTATTASVTPLTPPVVAPKPVTEQ